MHKGLRKSKNKEEDVCIDNQTELIQDYIYQLWVKWSSHSNVVHLYSIKCINSYNRLVDDSPYENEKYCVKYALIVRLLNP